MAARPVHHPVFARLCAAMSYRMSPELIEHRRRLLARLSGRVLELGPAMASTFPSTRRRSPRSSRSSPSPTCAPRPRRPPSGRLFKCGYWTRPPIYLPVPDGSLDAAVCSLVLCSVPDQARALAELHRVLRSDGELRFYEQVLSHDPRVARTQRLVDRLIWPRAFGGCHTARDTPAAIAAAGFSIEDQQALPAGPRFAVPVRLHVLGSARKV